MTDLDTETIEAEGVIEVIGEVVKQIHALSLALDLSGALRAATIDPSLRMYLSDAVGKLGRYYSAASELVCAARHRACRLFESIEIEPFQIPVPTSLSRSHGKVHAEIQQRAESPSGYLHAP